MGDEKADAVDEGRRAAVKSFEEITCDGWAFELLIFSCGAMVLFFGGMDADVMKDGCGFEEVLCFLWDILQMADEGGEGMDLQEMLDALCIAMVESDGFLDEFAMVHIKSLPLFVGAADESGSPAYSSALLLF